jgi:hypothetical protein
VSHGCRALYHHPPHPPRRRPRAADRRPPRCRGGGRQAGTVTAEGKRGQLLVTVPNCSPKWHRRLAAYRRLAARTKEAAETGFYRQALDRYDHEVVAIEHRFGDRTVPEARHLIRAAFERVDAVEEAFYDHCTAPMQRAAVRLANTPTPDLAALVAKIRVIQEQELDELGSMTRPLVEVLAEDVKQLMAAN